MDDTDFNFEGDFTLEGWLRVHRDRRTIRRRGKRFNLADNNRWHLYSEVHSNGVTRYYIDGRKAPANPRLRAVLREL